MTPHQIVVVGLRLVAILWLIHVVAQIPLLLAQSAINPDASDVPLVGVVGFFQLAVCAILWFFPASIARKLLPSPNNDVVYTDPPASHDWLTLGSILIGLWVLSGAVSDAVYWSLFVSLNPFDSTSGLDAEGKASIITVIFELAIGAWLVFGARGVGAFLWKIRTGGVSKS